MNADRRKRVDAIRASLEELKGKLEEIASDEQNALDNLPDSIRDGERGQAMEEAAQNLEDAATNLCDVITSLEEVTQ